MRVLRISHSATITAWRGRERALRDAGDDITLITAPRWHAGGVWVDLDAQPEEQVRPARTCFGRHPALFVYAPGPLWRALGERWDVIDIHEEPFALSTAQVLLMRALRRNSAPIVLYTAQNLDKRYPVPFRWLERWALRSAAGVSACNTEAARIAMRKGFAGRARVIPLGVDAVTTDAAAPQRTSGTHGSLAARESDHVAHMSGRADGDGVVMVGLLGRLVPEKGVLTLFEAMRERPALRARIGGSGPLADTLPDLAAAHGIEDRVQLLGAISPDKVIDFYRSIDVLAVPSIPTDSWTEQFGRVAVEAMAAGVPVVSSDAGALPDVVGGAGIVVSVGGAGIVVSVGDPERLAEALETAAGPRRAELIEAGLKRAQECSWESVAAQYQELYRSVAHATTTERGLEIIVVAYGAVDMLRRALTPVAALPVTVIDNSSMPEIAALCAELGIRYRDSGGNIGFGSAVNLALTDRLVPGGDVLLLNPDAEIDADAITRLHTALRAEPDLASVGPAQVDDAGHSARVLWPFPAPHRSWLEAVGLARLIRGPQFVIGSMLLLRAEALDQVGGFDERFFLYAEETDWAYRAHLLGWRHTSVPAVQAVHAAGGTSTDPRRREAHFHASQERYFRKHFGAGGWQSARLAAWVGATARSIVLRGERGAAARRRAALYCLGPVRVEQRFRRAG
ncbi:glycosyltransferase involved in cell wall biosynthesis/GT2 family glycosyltransferase [Microbacterium sp. W4I4]|uniref:glycosyltransferase n=1 Tax=Microbacterium sp. W4I4 TaxID=3042295 RepID=UPI0027812916|nr:glycosyltransferase [Microbacterium sp. W4I4]MDQ0613760.1 glycosyltransferase involved in cell wall biosynthesis/GT2 family glycosyltransferase [Microbacterium sp. W4I4]